MHVLRRCDNALLVLHHFMQANVCLPHSCTNFVIFFCKLHFIVLVNCQKVLIQQRNKSLRKIGRPCKRLSQLVHCFVNGLFFIVRCRNVKQRLTLFLYASVFLRHLDGAFQWPVTLRRRLRCSGGQSKFRTRSREERLRSRRRQTLHEAPKLCEILTYCLFIC